MDLFDVRGPIAVGVHKIANFFVARVGYDPAVDLTRIARCTRIVELAWVFASMVDDPQAARRVAAIPDIDHLPLRPQP